MRGGGRALAANQRPGSGSRDHRGPMRGRGWSRQIWALRLPVNPYRQIYTPIIGTWTSSSTLLRGSCSYNRVTEGEESASHIALQTLGLTSSLNLFSGTFHKIYKLEITDTVFIREGTVQITHTITQLGSFIIIKVIFRTLSKLYSNFLQCFKIVLKEQIVVTHSITKTKTRILFDRISLIKASRLFEVAFYI